MNNSIKSFGVTMALLLSQFALSGPAQASITAVGPVAAGPIMCIWSSPFATGSNVYFTHTGITGIERGFLIRHGDYDTTHNRIDYSVEYLADPSDCSGESFIVRFPMHGTDDHVEIEILEDDETPLGSLVANKGEIPVIFDQDGIALNPSVLGPFVINNGMINQVDRILLFTLLDARVLSNLPEPLYFNGVLPTNWLQELFMGMAYNFGIGQRTELYDLFRFRRMLTKMSSSAKTRASDILYDRTFDPGIYTASVWEDHPFVDHSIGVTPKTSSTYGGFLNGHRYYLMDMEAKLKAADDSERTPFRRIPAWRSEQTVPSQFDVLISSRTSSQIMPTPYEADNVCEAYNPSSSGALTLEARMEEAEEDLYSNYEPWHGSTHVDLGGDMAFMGTASRAPIFWAWHTTIDMVWLNWQLCWPGWDADDYDWH